MYEAITVLRNSVKLWINVCYHNCQHFRQLVRHKIAAINDFSTCITLRFCKIIDYFHHTSKTKMPSHRPEMLKVLVPELLLYIAIQSCHYTILYSGIKSLEGSVMHTQ